MGEEKKESAKNTISSETFKKILVKLCPQEAQKYNTSEENPSIEMKSCIKEFLLKLEETHEHTTQPETVAAVVVSPIAGGAATFLTPLAFKAFKGFLGL